MSAAARRAGVTRSLAPVVDPGPQQAAHGPEVYGPPERAFVGSLFWLSVEEGVAALDLVADTDV